MSITATHRHALASTAARSGGSPLFWMTRLYSVWRSRQALGRLDNAMLEDIGLSAKSAYEEAAKPIWDVPQNWRY